MTTDQKPRVSAAGGWGPTTCDCPCHQENE